MARKRDIPTILVALLFLVGLSLFMASVSRAQGGTNDAVEFRVVEVAPESPSPLPELPCPLSPTGRVYLCPGEAQPWTTGGVLVGREALERLDSVETVEKPAAVDDKAQSFLEAHGYWFIPVVIVASGTGGFVLGRYTAD
jgi:hypothetical protein